MNGVIEVCEVLAAETCGIGGHFRRNERKIFRQKAYNPRIPFLLSYFS